MRKSALIFALAAMAFFAYPAKNQQPVSTRWTITAIPYTSGNLPASIQPQVGPWLAQHFGIILDGGLDLTKFLAAPVQNAVSPGASPVTSPPTWAKYVDSAYIYSPGFYPAVRATATTNGFANVEDIFLHINQDYAVSPNLVWKGMDQFDYFEQQGAGSDGTGSPNAAVNGAFTVTGRVYTDVTSTLYDGAHQIAVPDRLVLGFAEPFDLINVNVGTARAGGSVTWQYWNGAWTNLPLVSDGTGQLGNSGAIQFRPPADWHIAIFNKSQPKYWVQAVVSGTATAPVLSRVFGDDWVAHGNGVNVRGWSASDPHRINIGSGDLEYNPTPPANATARFRYQARATGMWVPNANFGNPSDTQNGKPTWATVVLTELQAATASTGFGYTGVFFDDGGLQPQIAAPSVPIEKLSDLKSGTWASGTLNDFIYLRAQIRAARGNNFKVGANLSDVNVALQIDYSVSELSGSFPRTGNMALTDADQFLPSGNPLGSIRSFSLWNNLHFGLTEGGLYIKADEGDRTPMALLASYAVMSNPNTALLYNTFGWTYLDTDEVYRWSPPATTLTAPLSADSTNSSKMLALADDSAITLPGGPIWINATVATTAAQAGNVYGYVFKIGDDVIQPFRDGRNQWHTFTPVLGNYPAGTPVRFAVAGHQATDPVPNSSDVFYWANHFPAMDVDLGAPDTSGWNGGKRDTAYLVKAAASGNPAGCVGPWDCPEFWRRDFANAIVITHVFHDGNKPSELNTFGPAQPIALGRTYYPLHADGSTGRGISTLQLRAGEAAILMKNSLSAQPPPLGRLQSKH